MTYSCGTVISNPSWLLDSGSVIRISTIPGITPVTCPFVPTVPYVFLLIGVDNQFRTSWTHFSMQSTSSCGQPHGSPVSLTEGKLLELPRLLVTSVLEQAGSMTNAPIANTVARIIL